MTQIDLISNEWSDLLFENRNKEYGAYVLRQETGKRNLAAIVSVLAIFACAMGVLIAKNKYDDYKASKVGYTSVVDVTMPIEIKKAEVKRKEIVRLEDVQQIKEKIVCSIKFVAPVIKKDAEVDPADQMRTQDEIMNSKVAIGFADVVGNSDQGEVLRAREVLATEPVKPKEADVNKPFDHVEQMPTFPGGTTALMQYLSRNIKYPPVAEENGIQGRVICQFVVERDGSVSDVRIAKGIDPSLDKEAVRVVSSMPKWIPGKQNGQTVRVKFTLPVTFRLQ